MKPGVLEFRDIPSPVILALTPGCYVDYTRTGFRYKIYATPQIKKQARSSTYGGAFVYQGVQLFDASKMLEYCPFRDLVKGDNRIHFSTQPSISTFEGCDGLARRFEACLRDQYDVNGVQSWAVRIATRSENPTLYDLMMEPREFTVSGVSILECLEKIYEIWPDVGWVYKVENGIDTIVIGGGAVGANTGTYAYGKGNGLTSLTRTAANADEIANRIFAYGSSRNMLPRWYNNQAIKNAESVDIQNLMIPVAEWGLTDNLPDAAKAFVEDAASILKNGLRPTTVYFDGSGEYPEIYPSIRETTINMVRTAIGDSTAKYYPSTTIYTNPSERVDVLKSAQADYDSGKAGDDGKAAAKTDSESVADTASGTVPAQIPAYQKLYLNPFYSKTVLIDAAGYYTLKFNLPVTGTASITGALGYLGICIRAYRVDNDTTETLIGERETKMEQSASEPTSWTFKTASLTVSRETFSAGQSVRFEARVVFAKSVQNGGGAYSFSLAGSASYSASFYRSKTFTITLKQVGFDINEQADLGNGKTIAMRSGDCAGRSFAIESAMYDSATDSWVLECWRSEDESLSQWFPNSDYKVKAGDEFVLLDIAMPDIYVLMAEQKLFAAARELISETANEMWQYTPEIDAKFMVENGRTIRAGEYLVLSDADIIGPTPESILVDIVTISEGESAIPTYKVTLRDRKRKKWTEAEAPETTSSKSVGSSPSATDTPYVDLSGYVQEESFNDLSARVSALEDESFFMLDDDGNVTLKPQYQNLWVDGWLSAGGIGAGGGGGGGGLIESVLGVADLDTPIVLEDLSETFSAKAIQTIWDAVKVLQNTTPNVSLVNGANNSTLTVNGTTADFYTKSQIDAIVGAAYRPAGNASSVSELGTLTATNIGKVYNMTAAFTTTADFLEGAGKSFPAGTNVVIVDAGSGTYKYDVLSGFVDLSGYAQKVVGATNGNFAGLDANGNLADSGHKHGDYVTALGTSGNNLTWTKNGVTNNITVPFATNATTATKLGNSSVGHAHRPIYLNKGTATQVTDVASDFIGWPYASHSALSSIENLYYNIGPNVFAFPKADYIDVEYTNDGGSTWVDYEQTENLKKQLFTTSGSVYLGKKTSSSIGITTNDGVRVTVHLGVGCYCKCEFLAFRHYFPGQCTVKIEYTTYADTTTYVEHETLTNISGNPSYRIVPFSKFIFGNNGVHDLRITAMYTGTTYINNTYALSEIRAFGSNVYSVPSTYAKTGHIYTIDGYSQDAIFPAVIRPSSNGSQNLGSSSYRWATIYGKNGDLSGTLAVTGATTLNGGATIKGTGNAVTNINGATATVDYAHIFVTGGGSNTRPLVLQNGYGNVGIGVTQPSYKLAVGGTFNATGASTLSSTLSVADAITLSGSTNTARRIYFGDTNHYLELDEHGFHFSHGVYSDDFVSAGGIGNGGGSGSATELGDLVDVALSSPYNGDLLVYNSATSHWENKPQSSIIPSVSIGFNDLTSHPTTLAGYGITDAKIDNGVITLGGNTITPLTSFAETDPTVPAWAKEQSKPSYSLSEISGADDLRAIEALAGTAGLLKKTAENTWALDTNPYVYEVDTQGDGFLDFVHNDGNITRIDLNHEHSNYVPITRTVNGTPLSQDISITAQGLGVASWAMGSGSGSTVPFDVLPDLYALGTKVTDAPGLGILLGVSVMSANLATSVGDDTSRVQWDYVNEAWHFYGNVYVDGFLAGGGIGSGGGGGYGVEEITSNEDGTVDFHFTGGDVTTVDLNHEHPQYASKMAETSQPSGGFLPDVVYELGTLTGSVTFALASAVSGQVNHYFWTFTAGSTAPTITWPSGITWADSAPTITASKKYQISILDGVAAYMEA